MTLLNISDTALKGLSELQAENGLCSLNKGGWYTGHNLAAELDDVIYDATKEFVEEIIQERKTYSASFDESDSVAHEKVLAIVLRCIFIREEEVEVKINRNATGGVQTRKKKIKVAKSLPFPISLKEIKDGSSDTVLEAFEDELDEWKADKTKSSSVVTDGASVLTGKKNGVVTRFIKKNCPHCLAIHCVCHRLNLSGKDSTKKNPICKLSVLVLKSMRAVFSRSSHRCNILKAHQIANKEPALKVAAFYAVRWGALRPLIKMAVKCPISIQSALDEILKKSKSLNKKTKKKIDTVLNFFGKFETRAMILLQELVLDCMHKLFMVFESNELDFMTVQSARDGAIDYLTSLLSRSDESDLDEEDSNFDEDFEFNLDILEEDDGDFEEEDTLEDLESFDYEQPLVDYFDDGQNEIKLCDFEEDALSAVSMKKKEVNFGTESLKVSKAQIKSYNNAKDALIEDLIESLKHRLPDDELQIVNSMSRILNPSRKNGDEDDIKIIADHYSMFNVDEKLLRKEIENISQVKYQYSNIKDVKVFAGILVANYSDRFPTISLIAEIYLNLGLASAEAERIFSDMNRIMTKLRNRMSVTRMSKKVIISRVWKLLTKEESESILNRALEIFLTLKKRRRGQGSLE